MFFLLFPLIFHSSFSTAVQLQLGPTTIIGRDDTAIGQEFYGGLPFAEPPLGNLRFRAPVPKFKLPAGTFNATAFGPACLQPPSNQPSGTFNSEDCLTINVLRPANIDSRSAIPVMVWIHGGGFISSGAVDFPGTSLVAQSVSRGTPIIFVSLNYRMGPLGFPAGIEAAAHGSLNLGLKDQILGLEWVQANIAAFGGDKDKVTAFGGSAGAISIGILYLNSNFGSLARAAILDSGSADTTMTFDPLRRQNDWDNFANAVPGCSAIDAFKCLRAASSEHLQQAIIASLAMSNERFPWVPTLDGSDGVYPILASKLYKRGHFARVPFITGTNLDEATAFIPSTFSSADDIKTWIKSNFSSNPVEAALLDVAADTILKLYPDDPAVGSPFGTGSDTFGLDSQYKRIAAIYGDLMFHAPRRLWTDATSRVGLKSFVYHFTGPSLPFFPRAYGVLHGLDAYHVFGLVKSIPGTAPEVLLLATQMMEYWISFVVSLDPNDGTGIPRPTWPRYTTSQQNLLELHAGDVKVVPDTYRSAQIDALNSNPGLFRH